MNRKELEDAIMWNGGGGGFGLCSFANMMAWSMDCPTDEKPDLKSIVALGLPKEKYSVGELRKIVEFAKKKTAEYDGRFKYRRGANLVILDKVDRRNNEFAWYRKRLTWEFGPMYSPTLDEALLFMKDR